MVKVGGRKKGTLNKRTLVDPGGLLVMLETELGEPINPLEGLQSALISKISGSTSGCICSNLSR